MIYLITGGSGSGKSAYAENLMMGLPCSRRYYLATMAVYGEEGKAKVKRHHMLRQGKGLITLECQRDVGKALLVPDPDSAVLLECVSNLAANEMFRPESKTPLKASALAEKIIQDIGCLSALVRDLVIVTNEVAWDGNQYDEDTMEYIRLMGMLGGALSAMADSVVEVVYGIPIVLEKCRLPIG